MTAIYIILAVIVAFTVFVATRPNAFRLERSMVIKAPPEAIAPYVADFRKWTAWSPYEKLDADLRRTYSGTPSGVGAVYAWEGKKAGAGRMEITEASNSGVVAKLDFTKPMVAHNMAEFSFEPASEGTRVTWAMYGKCNMPSKLFSLFCNLDKMVGKDFEAGLKSLKSAVEA